MLYQNIQKDLQEALRNREERRLSILRLLLDAIIKKEKEKRAGLKGINSEQELVEKSRLTDEEVIQSISSLIKRGKEAVLQFEAGKRADLVEKEKQEIGILSAYLPEQLSEDEVKKIVAEAIQEAKAASLQEAGKVMAVVMPKVRGKADGTMVNKIVKEFLSSQG